MKAEETRIPVKIDGATALVLFELLARLDEDGKLTLEDDAEKCAVWLLHSALERRLVAPLAADYAERLRAARAELRRRIGQGVDSELPQDSAHSTSEVRMPSHSGTSGFPNRLLDRLHRLSDKQFAEVFYEAVASRNTSDLPEWRGHFVLADAASVDGGPWDIDFIALPLEAAGAEWSGEAPICQSGTCGGCKTDIRSWSKRVECPVCRQAVHCS